MLKQIFESNYLENIKDKPISSSSQTKGRKNKKNDISKPIIKIIDEFIGFIDKLLNIQLNEVIHNDKFQRLESSWRGIQYLVSNTEIDQLLKIKVMSCSKNEILKDKENAIDFDQSELYKKIYSLGIATPISHPYGAVIGDFEYSPYGAIIGDFEFSHNLKDIDILKHISGISAVAYSPFISAASHKLFGLKSYSDLNELFDLQMIFESKEYTKWNELRKRRNSQYVTLVLPRFLIRLPYGDEIDDNTTFTNYSFIEETSGKYSNYLWGNAAYALGVIINDSFVRSGWFSQITDETFNIIKGLLIFKYNNSKGNTVIDGPTEIIIPLDRARELLYLGFMPLMQYYNTSLASFAHDQTLHEPGRGTNRRESYPAPLNIVLSISRFAIFMKRNAMEYFTLVDNFITIEKLYKYFDDLLSQYILVNADQIEDPVILSKRPIFAKEIIIKKVEGRIGTYEIILTLQFHGFSESISTIIRIRKNELLIDKRTIMS